MAQLWGGRFTKETDQLVYNFNASISFDQKFYKQDIEGSIAHVRMLGKQGILTQEEMQAIVSCLQEILADVESGKLAITSEYEDIHSFVEANLIDRLGDTGKKLHTGRSRNDQVALDMRLYTRQQVLETDELLEQLLQVLLRIMKENMQTIMPGFTHLQKAQPITLAHHMGAYFEMFKRDRSRMHDIYERMNYCPLGSGALAGTTYPLDREYTAELLGFYGPTFRSQKLPRRSAFLPSRIFRRHSVGKPRSPPMPTADSFFPRSRTRGSHWPQGRPQNCCRPPGKRSSAAVHTCC